MSDCLHSVNQLSDMENEESLPCGATGRPMGTSDSCFGWQGSAVSVRAQEGCAELFPKVGDGEVRRELKKRRAWGLRVLAFLCYGRSVKSETVMVPGVEQVLEQHLRQVREGRRAPCRAAPGTR